MNHFSWLRTAERVKSENSSGFGDKVRLNGVVELNDEFLDVKEIDNKNSDSSADFFFATTELAISIY